MSVPASEKQSSKVEFLNNGQNLLIDVGHWVESQKALNKNCGLDHFFDLLSNAFISMSVANSIKIIDVDSYINRVNNFKKSKSYYKAAREYISVITVLYSIKRNRIIKWSQFLYLINIELDGIIKHDKKVAQKVVAKFSNTAKELNAILADHNRKRLKEESEKCKI